MVKQPLLSSVSQRTYDAASSEGSNERNQLLTAQRRRARLGIVLAGICLVVVSVCLVHVSHSDNSQRPLELLRLQSLDKSKLPLDALVVNSSNATAQLQSLIQFLKLKLKNATEEIEKLKDALKKCKPGDKDGKGSENEEKSDEDSAAHGPKSELEGEQQDRYNAYLQDFHNRDEASRQVWPWADDTLYYGKLGGENGIQYSRADEAIDTGHAEKYGSDKTVGFDDLDKSLSDSTYYRGS